MLEALKNALAELIVIEGRAHDLVDPVTALASAVKSVVKENSIVILGLCAKIASLEQQLGAISEHPALSIPDLPNAGASAAPTVAAATVAEAIGPSSEADAAPAPAPLAVQTDPAAGAPDIAKVFGFDDNAERSDT